MSPKLKSNICCDGLFLHSLLNKLSQGVKTNPVPCWGIIYETRELCHTEEDNVKEELLLRVRIPVLIAVFEFIIDHLIKHWKILFWKEIKDWRISLMLRSHLCGFSAFTTSFVSKAFLNSVKQVNIIIDAFIFKNTEIQNQGHAPENLETWDFNQISLLP